MKIAEFAKLYNSYMPSVDQMRIRSLKFNSTVSDLDIINTRNYLTFTYDVEVESDRTEERLFQLVGKTNISTIDPGDIVFYFGVKKSDHIKDGLEFASQNDYQKICLDIHSLKIVWYNDESDDVEVIAGGLDQFLLFLIESHKHKMNDLYRVTIRRRKVSVI